MEETHVHVHVETPESCRVEALLRRVIATQARLERKLDLLVAASGVILNMEEQQMTDLSQITAEVQQNGDVIESAKALLGSLAQQVRDLSTDPAALQALADQLDAQSNDLASAVAANTPAMPNPPADVPGADVGSPTPPDGQPGDVPPVDAPPPDNA